MPRFRSLKVLVRAWFRSDEWTKERPLPPECYEEGVATLSLVNPLFACHEIAVQFFVGVIVFVAGCFTPCKQLCRRELPKPAQVVFSRERYVGAFQFAPRECAFFSPPSSGSSSDRIISTSASVTASVSFW